MDHILQVRVEQQRQSSTKLCNQGVARFARSADASLVTLALSAIAFLALFLPPFPVRGSPSSSALSARLVAVVGSIFSSKTALFVLSNAIFVLLAADYRCRFAATASAGHAASSGEPGGVLEKQARHHQVQVQQVKAEQCAVRQSVPCSESLDDHNEQEGEEDKSTMSAKTLSDEEQLPKLELVRFGEEEEESIITLEETVDVEEPTCETAQELDGLEISELNKKFDEFIRNRRIKWVKEEAYLLLCEVGNSELFQTM